MSLLLDGTLGVPVTTVTGTLPVANGGTGVTTVGTSGNVLTSNGTAWVSSAVTRDYVLVMEEQPSGTSGGTFTSGAWQTRTINIEKNDDSNICSIASNQITLNAGTYEVRISAPALAVNRHKARLQNITDATTTLIGSSEYTNLVASSVVIGRFTIASSKVFEVQHRCETTRATDGFGFPSVLGVVEVYTIAQFTRVST